MREISLACWTYRSTLFEEMGIQAKENQLI
jgi:hypothetical protein